MKIYRSVMWDMETGEVLEEDSYEYDGPLARCDRAAVGQATTAENTASSTAAGEGSSASSISANLTPFLTQQLLHPQGYSQTDMTQQMNDAEAGAGGATSGITGQAALEGARSRNASGFNGALDDAARQRDKAAAGASEGIASKDADVKLQQQQQASNGLQGMYGTDTDAMLKSMGQESGDINSEVDASKTGWLQNAEGVVNTLSKAGLKL